jgi:chemotaxis response regulator CheB
VTLKAIRILLADDSAPIRHALCTLLSAHVEFQIVCESVSGAAAISKAGELQPDVILLDINLPDMNGLEVARQVKKVSPSAEILLLSEHDVLPMVQEGLTRWRTRLPAQVRRSSRVGDCDSTDSQERTIHWPQICVVREKNTGPPGANWKRKNGINLE